MTSQWFARTYLRNRQQLIASLFALRNTTLSTAVVQHWRKHCAGSRRTLQLIRNLILSRLLSTKMIALSEANPKGLKSPITLFAVLTLKTTCTDQPGIDGGETAIDDTITATIQRSDHLFEEHNFQEAYDVLQKCMDTEEYEIKWRLARVIFQLSKSACSPKKEQMVRESFQLVKEALALNPNHFASHSWYSVLLDAKNQLDGLWTRASHTEIIKKHMLKAVELNPNDATSWYNLGQYYYGMADLSWAERKVMCALFGATPAGTYEEALECFERAERLQPNFNPMNHLMLGKTHRALKNVEKAKECLTLAANVIVRDEDDMQAKEEATKLLHKL